VTTTYNTHVSNNLRIILVCNNYCKPKKEILSAKPVLSGTSCLVHSKKNLLTCSFFAT